MGIVASLCAYRYGYYMLEYRVRGVAHGECSTIDLMKRKEAIVLREE